MTMNSYDNNGAATVAAMAASNKGVAASKATVAAVDAGAPGIIHDHNDDVNQLHAV
jgi:hypothetical protein